MTTFVDTSAWFAAAVTKDRSNAIAKRLLSTSGTLITTDAIVMETWLLLARRYRYEVAERFWGALRDGAATVESVRAADFDAAWIIGRHFADQQFSLVDRTRFAVMERLGVHRVVSFDHDFSIYRFGPNRELAFEVLS